MYASSFIICYHRNVSTDRSNTVPNPNSWLMILCSKCLNEVLYFMCIK